jgi:hypothetical protein
MLTQEDHYGGSRYLTATGIKDLSLGARVIRVHQAASSGGPDGVRLPTMPRFEHANFAGRPVFYILCTGAITQQVRDPNNNVLGTVPSNHCAPVYYLGDTDSWRLGVVRTVHTHGSFAGLSAYENRASDVEDEETRPTFDPFCFVGDDCEYLASLSDQYPLDGEESHPEVVAPMYQDPNLAQNRDREAVRAADVIMPNLMGLRFNDGEFSVDTDHPWYGTYSLSEEFYDALYRRSSGRSTILQPHVLAYDAALSGAGTTSNWHHISREGGTPSWFHGTGAADLTARKHVWKTEIPYGPESDPEAYTLQIRLILEHTMSADAPADCNSGSGPDGSADKGMHGSLFTLCVFTDELNASWVDGVSTFQPFGFSSAHTITRADPAISGLAFSIADGATTDERAGRKGVHPQCVIMANLVTSWEAPIGRNKVPLINGPTYKHFKGANDGPGRNLERLYDVPNGCPWLSGACADTFPGDDGTWPDDTHGILYNCVFGWPSPTTFVGRAMTLGGDMLRSIPTEWLCFENGQGVGRTFLVPTKPGWSESCGKLDVAGGSSGTLFMCVGEDDWPVCEDMSTCDGHPDEPFEGVGGSHTCFRNRDQAQGRDGRSNTTCCIPIAPATAGEYQYCYREEDTYGDPDGGSCDYVGYACEMSGSFFTQFVMFPHDYSMQANANQTLREIFWGRHLPDPSRPLRDWEYDNGDADLSNVLGTFTKGASSLTVATVSGSKAIRAQASYDETSPSTWDWFGVEIECGFNGVNTRKHGLGFLNGSQDGWGMVVSPAGADLLFEVVEYTNNGATRSVLDSRTIAGEGSNATGLARYWQQGTDIVAEYTPTSGVKVTIEVEISDGGLFSAQDIPSKSGFDSDSACACEPSFYTESTSAGAVFDSFSSPLITDLVPAFLTMYGDVGYASVSISLEGDLLSGFGKCAGEGGNADCGTPPDCNCVYWAETLFDSSIHEAFYYHASNLDIGTVQTFIECLAVDRPCNPGDSWIDGSAVDGFQITYHGAPSPVRCHCESDNCSGNQCAECPPNNKQVMFFALPVSEECWSSAIDPGCPGSIPLMCRGIDVWSTTSCV